MHELYEVFNVRLHYIVALLGVLVLSGVARLQEQTVFDETAQLY